MFLFAQYPVYVLVGSLEFHKNCIVYGYCKINFVWKILLEKASNFGRFSLVKAVKFY